MTMSGFHRDPPLPRRPYVTTRTHEVFALALRLAERLGHEDVTDAHITLGMLQEGRGMGVAILYSRGVPLDAVAQELQAELPPAQAPRAAAAALSWTPAIERVLAGAVTESRTLGVEYHGVEHVLLFLLHDSSSTTTGTSAAPLGVRRRSERSGAASRYATSCMSSSRAGAI